MASTCLFPQIIRPLQYCNIASFESKNASQHHNSQKAHRNGIKKPKTHRYPSLRGVDAKFRRNHRHALHGTAKALKERKEGKREVA
ncbi:hypothetical protein ASPWEDRAFT_181120 [Aspergillus wentii DTO 134E9]|uniref:60S ribosomal protein L29 n=1 Tax=Aspergillus wentii DTO 134E9 TaxID=1073089 RepID=A0A1L9RXS6_ASPWE|nr:uncharacterized protein ASPWEDRAFT_181120 [Aspergillus wentii DTO 134E9]OJJ39756.1 hypothetical protein ASPWEDRAFT_181120 [Aspergillus wentii DTO 134E9]